MFGKKCCSTETSACSPLSHEWSAQTSLPDGVAPAGQWPNRVRRPSCSRRAAPGREVAAAAVSARGGRRLAEHRADRARVRAGQGGGEGVGAAVKSVAQQIDRHSRSDYVDDWSVLSHVSNHSQKDDQITL